ncbi:hypothetical protein ACWKWU_16420 [Chitinophaga lutea]
MLRIIWITCLLAATEMAAGSGYPNEGKVRTYTVRESDSVTYELHLALDEQNRPMYFYRNIFTPVCNTGECKPVYINLYWDLLGNYIRYDLPAGEPLTKMDHREFNPEEYTKFHNILAKENSILGELKMEDLVAKGTDNLSDSVNVKTGATIKTVRNEVIDGAVYTCYTIWHLAHGRTSAEIRRIMGTLASPDLYHRFLRSDNYHYQYWAMDSVLNSQGRVTKGYEDDIAAIIGGDNIFAARTVLQRLDGSFFSPKRQQELWKVYDRSAYPLQMAILQKMAQLPLTQPLIALLADDLESGNRELRMAKAKAIAAQPKIAAATQRRIVRLLQGDFAGEIGPALQNVQWTDEQAKRAYKQYETTKK